MNNSEYGSHLTEIPLEEFHIQLNRLTTNATELLDASNQEQGEISKLRFAAGESSILSYPFLPKAVNAAKSICNAIDELSNLNRYASSSRIPFAKQEDCEGIVCVSEDEDVIIVKSPHFPRRRRNCTDKVPFEACAMRAIANANGSFAHCGRVDMYVVTVYPEGTPEYRVIDCDNFNTKAIGDAICAHISIDDNGLAVRWIQYAMLCDEIEPATYTIVARRSNSIFNEAQIIRLIKDHYHM